MYFYRYAVLCVTGENITKLKRSILAKQAIFFVSFRLLGADMACTIFEVPIGSTSVYMEQDTPDKNLLGKQILKLSFRERDYNVSEED